MAVQDAWEAAEAATIGAPPGPTPGRQRPAGPRGVACRRPLRRAGQRDLVGAGGATAPEPPALLVGPHIPGHWAKGMLAPVRLVTPGGCTASGRYPLAVLAAVPERGVRSGS